MATVKQNLGKIPCPACGDSVAIYKSATGKLSYTCQHPDCESTGYAAEHTGAAKKWLAALPPKAVPEQQPKALPEQQPKAVKKADPAPVPPKAKASTFSVLGL